MTLVNHPARGLAISWLAVWSALPGGTVLADDARRFVSNEYFTFGASDYNTVAVELADVDGDGDLDAVMVNGRHWARPDLVLLNNGFGRFLIGNTLGQELATGYQPAVTDLNGDAMPDVVVARDRVPSHIFVNTGDGTFRDAGPVGPTGPTRAVAAADVDLDGATDLIFSLRGKNNQIAFGPDFDRVAELQPAEQSVRLAVADLNDDSFPDLVFANLGSEGSLIQFNDGEGGFSRSVRLDPDRGRSVDVAIGDIDADGLPDVVLASVGTNTVFLNDQQQEFTQEIPFGSDDVRSYGIALADLDQDGRTDIAVANAGSTNAIYMNRPDGLLRIELPEDPDALSYDVSIGDLDGNEFPDLVFANSGSMSRIYLNVTEGEAETALSR